MEKKENKHIENKKKEHFPSMIRDTKDTKDTKDTGKKRDKSIKSIKSIPYHRGWACLGKSALDQIFNHLFKSNHLNYEQLAKKIKNTNNYVKLVINRNKIYFQEAEKQGGIKFFKLSDLGKAFVQEKIDQYEIAQAFLKKREVSKIAENKQADELLLEVQSIKTAQIYKRENKSLIFDFEKLAEISPVFTESLMVKPEEMISLLKSVFQEDYNIRIKNIPESSNVNIENLRSGNINKLTSVEARVVSLSSVKPISTLIKYECPSCGSVISVLQNEATIREPSRCSCGRKGSFKFLAEELENISKIILEDLQEKTDNPHTQRVVAWVKGDLTNSENIKTFTPGNEIKCIGILHKIHKKIHGKGVSTIADYYFEIINAEMFEPELDIENFSEDEINQIKKVANKINQNGLRELNSSFAPEVVGENQIKNALILQLCNKKNNPNTPVRNKPNILLIGDPGTAKSILCKFQIKINPESRECSGGGSSAVGITASVIKEDESMGGYRVEPGALVLAKDILFIDELNNLSDEDKPKLQEAMSEQIIRINKAGLHLKLKVTAGITATANPKYGSFKANSTYISQFNLPEPIINRFDLIFILHDVQNKDRDEMIASQMIAREKGIINVEYPQEFLRKFFVYVRNFETPKFSGDAEDQIKQVYLKIRKENASEDIIINPRALESLIRLVKASAKSRLSPYVEEKDIERALKILGRSHFQTSEYKQFNFKESEVSVGNN